MLLVDIIVDPRSLAIGIVIGALFAGPLAMWLIASLAVANRIGDRKRK